jgi:hypothetical protein
MEPYSIPPIDHVFGSSSFRKAGAGIEAMESVATSMLEAEVLDLEFVG